MRLFDIGANRGDAVKAGLERGFSSIVACEPAPKVFSELARNFIYAREVVPLRLAISDKDNERVTFFEADEDGLSTLNENWLTDENLPYAGKSYQITKVNTMTLDTLCVMMGEPDLVKIDVEGAEWNVFRGMTKHHGMIAFEWTFETINEHEAQLDYLYALGYREVALQYIVEHLKQPTEWFELKPSNARQLYAWHQETSDAWIDGGWKEANLRPTADVGMCWVR